MTSQMASDGNADLTKLKFYHGVQTREDTQLLMKDAQIGDFLLRTSFLKLEVKMIVYFCIKVCENDIHHYLIAFRNCQIVMKQELMDREGIKKIIESKPFNSFDEMINFYRVHRLACGIRLSRSLNRPKYQLRNSEVHYEESGKLGSGNFCTVYRGILKRGNREDIVAIKVSKQTEHPDPAQIMETKKELFAEAKIMIAYNHVNVIKLFGLACDLPPFMVCLEFCNGGSLESHLYKHGNEMEEFERQTLLIDSARGMRYLHANKCIHRDLASRNCLISAEGFIKIADFGLSKSLGADETKFKEALKEAPLVWLAPECIQKESEFSAKSDVWAFGVLMYEVYFNGAKPFSDEKDTSTLIRNIRKANMPLIDKRTKIPKMIELHSSIFTRKPEDRIDFQTILEKLVDSLISHDPLNLAKMEVNKLDGVERTKMPNICVEPEKMPRMLEPKSSHHSNMSNMHMMKKRDRNTGKKWANYNKEEKAGGGNSWSKNSTKTQSSSH
ncbi:unnamed protein product [Caenorhabditis angaria]|uniref:Tyrosine-protein kinase n=1 Tax=Caenorhabditis angaria TaxID=860376 RepID=A0A9P1I4H7_9PELO|nr:unnamed protein product [Caenorhabditis angaria]